MNSRTHRIMIAGVVLALSIAANQVFAQTTWTNVVVGSVVTGLWNTAENWDNGVPNGNLAGVTNASASYVVNADAPAASFTQLLLGNAGVNTSTLNVNTDTFSITGGIDIRAKGRLVVNAGGKCLVGRTGTDSVSPAGDIVVNGFMSWLFLASPSIKGLLQINDGGVLSATGNGSGGFGPATAGGRIVVESGGILTNANNQFKVVGGCVVTNRGTIVQSFVTSGANWPLNVGFDGVGTFQMEGGSLYVGATSGMTIGAAGSGNNCVGTFNLTGGAVTNKGRLTVGASQNNGRNVAGALMIDNASWVNASDANVYVGVYNKALAFDSTGKVAGTITVTNNGDFGTLGSVYVASGGLTGTVAVASGGRFAVTNATGTGLFSMGMDGGLPEYASSITNIGKGLLTVNGGTFLADRIVATNGALSAIAFAGGEIGVASATINGATPFTVGNGTTAATLHLGNGAHAFASGLTVSSNAVVSFANSTGTLNTATLTLLNGSTSRFSFASATAYGRVVVADTQALGGTLDLAFTYPPETGTVFDLFDWGTGAKSGAFADIAVSGLGAKQRLDLSEFDSLGRIKVVTGGTVLLVR